MLTVTRTNWSRPMSTSPAFGPLPQKPAGSNRNLVIVLVSVGVASMLCCGGGVCGGLLFVVGRSKTTLAQMKASLQEQLPAPLVAPRWEQDWMVMEHLTRAYTTALDAAAADKQVIEHLGQPVEPLFEADTLFRRERTGTLSQQDETIEFDVQGPKGKGLVRVESGTATGPPGSFPWSRTRKSP